MCYRDPAASAGHDCGWRRLARYAAQHYASYLERYPRQYRRRAIVLEPSALDRPAKCIDLSVTARYPQPNAKKASIRLVNRVGDNSKQDHCPQRYKH
jgi:hypothetical protein